MPCQHPGRRSDDFLPITGQGFRMQRLANQLRRNYLPQVDDNSTPARAAQPEASGYVAGSSRASVAGLPARVRTGAGSARQIDHAATLRDTPPLSYDAQLAQWESAAPGGEERARRITVERIQRVVGKWLARRVDLSELGLTSLPSLPRKLKELDASGNKLTALPVLPSELTSLRVCKNRLTALPDLPVKL